MDTEDRDIAPQATLPSHDTPYYRNTQLSVRAGRFTLVDASGTAHVLAADRLGWVVAGNGTPRFLVLGSSSEVLAELPPDGWDLEMLAEFGDATGVPLVAQSFPDAVSARGAYPLRKGTVRVHAKEVRTVALQFLPVLVPVLLVIVALLIFG